MIMLLSALRYISNIKNMTVFMLLIFILRGFQKWEFFPSLKAHNFVKRTRISIWHTFMGLWNDYVVCFKRYSFKGSTKYYRFYVIDYNFAKVYRIGPSFHL